METNKNIIGQIDPKLATEEKNTLLISVPYWDVIKNIIFTIDSISSPGPDDCGGCFYHSCWDIIGKEVSFEVQDLFFFFLNG